MIFGVEGGIRGKQYFEISTFELHGPECSISHLILDEQL